MSNVVEQQATGTWVADPVHSSVGFEVRHMVVATFRGGFGEYAATLDYESGEPRLTGTVRTASVEVRDENLAAHLQSPEFFDSESHPELRFASTAVRGAGDDLVIEGDLTIKGVTRPVEARGRIAGPAEDASGRPRIGVQLTAIVDRTAFGLDWNQPLPKGGVALANDVRLVVDLSLVRDGE